MLISPSVAIIGCSDLGIIIAERVMKHGCRLAGVADISLSVARQAADLINTDRFTIFPWEITWDADIVFITCPDGQIQETCSSIAMRCGFRECSMVYHFSNRFSYSVLNGAKRCGAYIGSVTMVQPSAVMKPGENFSGLSRISIEGEDEAVSAGILLWTMFEAQVMQE